MVSLLALPISYYSSIFLFHEYASRFVFYVTSNSAGVTSDSLAPPVDPVVEGLGSLERLLTAHQEEMKRLLVGSLGPMCRRLEAVEQRVGQLCEQSASHRTDMALLSGRMDAFCDRLMASHVAVTTGTRTSESVGRICAVAISL